MDKIQNRFEEYHAANPHIYALFAQLSREVQATGKTRYSIWAVANRVRWHYDVVVNSADPFRISNDYFSRYARLLMAQEPDLKGFFVVKALKYGEPTTAALSEAA